MYIYFSLVQRREKRSKEEKLVRNVAYDKNKFGQIHNGLISATTFFNLIMRYIQDFFYEIVIENHFKYPYLPIVEEHVRSFFFRNTYNPRMISTIP